MSWELEYVSPGLDLETCFSMVWGLENRPLGFGPKPGDIFCHGLWAGEYISWTWPRSKRRMSRWFGGWKMRFLDLAQAPETHLAMVWGLEDISLRPSRNPRNAFFDCFVVGTHAFWMWPNPRRHIWPWCGGCRNISFGFGPNPRDTFFDGLGVGECASWIWPNPGKHICHGSGVGKYISRTWPKSKRHIFLWFWAWKRRLLGSAQT